MFNWFRMPTMPTFFSSSPTPATPATPSMSSPPANTPLGVSTTGARRKSHRSRTYRKEKRPAKRRRNGKRSIRS